jgi:hypothetical protein
MLIAPFIRCESDEAFISWVVGFQALMALHEALSGGFDALSNVLHADCMLIAY